MTALPPLAPLESVRIAVDCMGGDHGAAVTLPACRAFLDKHPEAELLLVGTAEALPSLKSARGADAGRIAQLEAAGPWLAGGANLGLYVGAGLVVVGAALFFVPDTATDAGPDAHLETVR